MIISLVLITFVDFLRGLKKKKKAASSKALALSVAACNQWQILVELKAVLKG